MARVCACRRYSRELLDLLLNVDKLLATDGHFLLGVWLESAKNLSTDDQERRLYEYNARNQITLWGPDGNVRRISSCLVLHNDQQTSSWSITLMVVVGHGMRTGTHLAN